MPYCSVCLIDYDPGKKFCRECGGKLEQSGANNSTPNPLAGLSLNSPAGSSLRPADDRALSGDELNCPSCGAIYGPEKKFCKTCGVMLGPGGVASDFEKAQAVFPEPFKESPLLPRPSRVASLLKKKKKLGKKAEKLKILISNLEAQKGIISEEALVTALEPYQRQLETQEKEINEIVTYLANLQERLGLEIDGLEQEEAPFGKRCLELKALLKAKGLRRGDFRRLHGGPRKTSNILKKQIKKRRKLMRLVSSPDRNAPRDTSFYVKTAVYLLAAGILLATGYLGYQYYFQKIKIEKISSPTDQITSLSSPLPSSFPVSNTPEEEIKKVFETIKKATEAKDIDLFMSCYSLSFPSYAEKKINTMMTWKENNISDMNFTMRDLIVGQDTAEVAVEWQFANKRKKGGKSEPLKVTNKAIFKKENGSWKISDLNYPE